MYENAVLSQKMSFHLSPSLPPCRYVNEVNLEHASLDDAVQALKGAARGIVKIGVSKPLPVPDGSREGTDSAANTYFGVFG